MKLGRQWLALEDAVADLRQVACGLLAHLDRRLVVCAAVPAVHVLTDPLAVRGILRSMLAHAARGSAGGDVALRITGNPYTVRFSVETPRAAACGPSHPVFAGGTYLTLEQARRTARLLEGEITEFEAGTVHKLELALPRIDAGGNSLLRAAGAPRTAPAAAAVTA